MTLKEIIISEFLNDDHKNFNIYGTDPGELSRMYDKFLLSVKQKEDFNRFLNFENATTADGKIKFDMTTDYFDKETKKAIKTKVVFKFAVYSFFNSRYHSAIASIQEKENQIPLPELAL